jgi:hypothetical protein
MVVHFLFLPFRGCCEILLITKTVLFTRGSNFTIVNSTGVFLPSIPFPLGARQTFNGTNQSIEEFRSLQIENSSTVFQFPNAKRFALTYWRIPPNLCPAPSYLLNADFHITSRSLFQSSSDLCFFVDPRGIGYLITVVTSSVHILTIQFYVNHSNNPHYECVSVCPKCPLICPSPFDQPFFVRIPGVANCSLSLHIECSIRHPADQKNGCFVSRIPTALLTGEDSLLLQPQNSCISLPQRQMRSIVKIAAIVTFALSIAILGHRLGYWDFSGWTDLPHGVEYPNAVAEQRPWNSISEI